MKDESGCLCAELEDWNLKGRQSQSGKARFNCQALCHFRLAQVALSKSFFRNLFKAPFLLLPLHLIANITFVSLSFRRSSVP